MSRKETQQSIAEWATAEFGELRDVDVAFRRLDEEYTELDEAVNGLRFDKEPKLNVEKIANEAADVLVTLYNLCSHLKIDLHQALDMKMAVNRKRKWVAHGDGTGHHVKQS